MTDRFDRRHFAKAAVALATAATLPVRAQETRPLRIIVPLPAGGVADASARFFAEAWTAQTRQQVVIDNRPGGNYQIGVQQLLQAPADGNTWIHISNAMSATQATFNRFDLTRQVMPLGLIGSTPATVFVGANSPFQSLRDLLDWLRANPGKGNFGSTTGSVDHMVTATLLKRNGLSATFVAFKGGPDICTALAQNELHFAISALPLIVPFKGRIRPLALMIDQRSPMMPELPTYRELGLDAPALNYWGGFAVPAATPEATVAALHKTLAEVVKTPSLMTKYMTQGMMAHSSPPEAMAKIIADEVRWMTPVAAELDLKGA